MKSNRDSTKVFSIIGMGFTGTGLFCQLVEKLIILQNENPSIQYTIIAFDKTKELFGAGLPYQSSSPNTWLLNTPANKFKLMKDGIDLASWMQANKEQWQRAFSEINEEYVPRALAGLYLKSQYQVYKEKAYRHGIKINECYDEVIDMSSENASWKLKTDNTNNYDADFTFLCFGHLPSDHYSHLKSKPNYFHAVFDVEKLKCIPKTKNVYILGGQASFVDIALWLAFENVHTGKITTVTRNSPIITSKSKTNECDDKDSLDKLKKSLNVTPINSLSLADGKLLFWDAYKSAAKNPVDIFNLPTTKAALSYQWKKYIDEPVENGPIGNIDELRSFIFTFYFSGCYGEFWDKLRENDKIEFNNQMYSHIFAFLTGIPPLNARLLLNLYERDQIHEQSGFAKVTYHAEQEKFILHFKDGTIQETEYLIDSTGIGYDISKCNFPLIQNLYKRGLLVPKKWGGILLNDYAQPFDAQGQLQENVFCIGPTASYGHKYPTPYASFIAIEAIEKVLNAPIFESQILSKLHSMILGR
jgi:uncharacterized NAD(P)/FAD-binding protein YdhS